MKPPRRRPAVRAGLLLALPLVSAPLLTGTAHAAGDKPPRITLSDARDATSFAADLPGLLPGERAVRHLDLLNDSGESVAVAGRVTGTGPLTGPGGLTVAVATCAAAWAGETCAGGGTDAAAQSPLAAPVKLAPGRLAARGTSHLKLVFTLPDAAPQSLQGATGTATVSFTATGTDAPPPTTGPATTGPTTGPATGPATTGGTQVTNVVNHPAPAAGNKGLLARTGIDTWMLWTALAAIVLTVAGTVLRSTVRRSTTIDKAS